jgi:hypothetical protein
MKKLIAFAAMCSGVYGQGAFIYDQQSANETTGGGGAVAIQVNEPIGQSFTPALSSVGFIRLFLSDNGFNSVGATVYVNLRTNSITGPLLSSTDPVFMPDRFSGYTNCIFVTPLAVVPGVT